MSNLDFMVMRSFRWREDVNVQFRAEFFNFTNTPPFANPVNNIQTGSADQVLSAGSSREIQFGLKVMF